ncbi:hypothetical protein NFJ02_34g85850 [Pycnococcus provasolii]
MQDSRVESRLDDGAGVVEPLGQPQPQPRQQTKEIVPPLKVNFSNEETNLVQTQARDRVDSSLRGTSPSPSPSAPSSSSVRRFKRSNSFADFADKITPRFIKSVSRKLEERAHKKKDVLIEKLRQVSDQRMRMESPTATPTYTLEMCDEQKKDALRNVASVTNATADVVRYVSDAGVRTPPSTSDRNRFERARDIRKAKESEALDGLLASMSRYAAGADAGARIDALRDKFASGNRQDALNLVRTLRQQLEKDRQRLVSADVECLKRMSELRYAMKITEDEAETLCHGLESKRLRALVAGENEESNLSTNNSPNKSPAGNAHASLAVRSQSLKASAINQENYDVWRALTPMRMVATELRRMGVGKDEKKLGEVLDWIVRIQAFLRMVRTRRFYRALQKAVRLIQRIWRGYRCRKQWSQHASLAQAPRRETRDVSYCRTHSLSLTPKDGSVHVDVSSDSEEEGKSVSRSSSTSFTRHTEVPVVRIFHLTM